MFRHTLHIPYEQIHADDAHRDDVLNLAIACSQIEIAHQLQLSQYSRFQPTITNVLGTTTIIVLVSSLYVLTAKIINEVAKYDMEYDSDHSNTMSINIALLAMMVKVIAIFTLVYILESFDMHKNIQSSCLYVQLPANDKIIIDPILEKFKIVINNETLTRDVRDKLFEIEKKILLGYKRSYQNPTTLRDEFINNKSYFSLLCRDVINIIEPLATLKPQQMLFCEDAEQRKATYYTMFRRLVEPDNNIFKAIARSCSRHS